MLERLEVHNLAVIEAAELEFGPGLNVLTGETGAGKSLLVDALSLLLGARAERAAIRPGAEAALVTAWVDGRVYSRRVGARSTPRIEGEVVTLEELAHALREKIALHAQHAAQTLTRPSAQQRLVDSLVPAEVRTAYQRAYARARGLKEELEALRRAARERAQRLDLLRFQVREIEAARLDLEEEETLRAELKRLLNVEGLRERLSEAVELLGGEVDAAGAVGRAAARIEQAARLDPELGPLAEELSAAEDTLSSLLAELERRLEGLEADPARLEAVEARLAELERLKRKYGDSIPEVLAYLEKARAELSGLEHAEDRAAELEAELKAAEAELNEVARALTAARKAAKAKIEAGVKAELAALALPEARLEVRLSPLPEPGPKGAEEVRLFFSANPGLPLSPLEKAASGGELSRTLLALLLVTGLKTETVVLDEIDAGLGGEAARALADRLARLSERHQVLIVTHLPQVAARAGTHYRVRKEKGRARVERLGGEARVKELARMLSGTYSDAALAHARDLLNDPARQRPAPPGQKTPGS